MKAAVQEKVGQPLSITDLPTPTPGTRDAVLKVEACGVCHTDLHLAEGFFRPLGVDVFPIVPGHEVVGVVEEVGSEVTHVKRGDRVGAHFFWTCGLCPHCLSGDETGCMTILTGAKLHGFSVNGGYAEYMVAPADRLIQLPDGMDFTDAAPLFCGGVTMYGGFKNAGLRADQRVAILGIGGLGHIGIQIARAMGAEVIAITSKGKEEWARDLGAHHVITGNGDVGEQLLALGGADVIVSTTIESGDISSVMKGLRLRGSYVLVGMTAEPLSIMPAGFAFAQHRLIGSIIGSRRDQAELLELAVRSDIRPVTEVYPLDQVNEVHDRLRQKKVRIRAVLKPS